LGLSNALADTLFIGEEMSERELPFFHPAYQSNKQMKKMLVLEKALKKIRDIMEHDDDKDEFALMESRYVSIGKILDDLKI
jgi:hypothetical protein